MSEQHLQLLGNGYERQHEILAILLNPGGVNGFYNPGDLAANGMNDWNGVMYSNSAFADFKADQADFQRQALADAISYASDSPDGSNWDEIYNNLKPDKNGKLQIWGGNVDFTYTGQQSTLDFVPQSAWDTGGCEVTCRYGAMGAIHFDNGTFHLDTASPTWGFGLGLFMHGFVDILLGNINPSVPMIR